VAGLGSDPDLSVDVDRLRALAGSLRETAAGLDGMLAGLVAERAALDLVGAAPVTCG
jgi:hypothetical protein